MKRATSVPSVIFIPDDLFGNCDCDSSRDDQNQPRRHSDPSMPNGLVRKRWDATVAACNSEPPSRPCRRHAGSNEEEDQELGQKQAGKVDKARNPPRMPRRSLGATCLGSLAQKCCRSIPLAAKSLPPRCPRRLASQTSFDQEGETCMASRSEMSSSISSQKSRVLATAA